MSTMANTPEGAYHAKRAALVKHRALEADNARQRALIAELVEQLERARKCIVYCRRNHPDPQKGAGVPVEVFIDAVLSKARGESA